MNRKILNEINTGLTENDILMEFGQESLFEIIMEDIMIIITIYMNLKVTF